MIDISYYHPHLNPENDGHADGLDSLVNGVKIRFEHSSGIERMVEAYNEELLDGEEPMTVDEMIVQLGRKLDTRFLGINN